MAKRREEVQDHPNVVFVGEPPTITPNEWLAILRTREPMDLGRSAAEFLAEVRTNGE